MRFFHLIKQYDRVRFSSDCLGELSALFIAYISRRRSDQTGHGIFLHVLTHIETYHVALIIKQARRQCFGKLRFSDTGRSEEQKRTDRLGRVFDARFGTDDRLSHFCDALILSDDPFVQFFIEMQGLVSLALI